VLVEALKEVKSIITSDDQDDKKKNVTQHFDQFIKDNSLEKEALETEALEE
jgi:hypothetical protein